MSEPHNPPAPEPAPDAARRRDQGMRRASNATRWSFAAAAAGTAALGLTYLHLIPGAGSSTPAPTAPVQADQPAGGWTCTTTTARASVPAPAWAVDDERDGGSDDRAVALAPVSTPTTCVTTGAAPGLAPPGQPPAATQQAPQTRTGAS